jgi:hypothetical protein
MSECNDMSERQDYNLENAGLIPIIKPTLAANTTPEPPAVPYLTKPASTEDVEFSAQHQGEILLFTVTVRCYCLLLLFTVTVCIYCLLLLLLFAV